MPTMANYYTSRLVGSESKRPSTSDEKDIHSAGELLSRSARHNAMIHQTDIYFISHLNLNPRYFSNTQG